LVAAAAIGLGSILSWVVTNHLARSIAIREASAPARMGCPVTR
jgi:hypothetical protein